MAITTKKNIEIRYGETDQMGVVYHGSYPAFLEIGRIDWLKQMGFSYAMMEKEGYILPVISLNINFKRSLFFGEVLKLETSLTAEPKVKISFEYMLYNDQDLLVGSAATTLAFLDKQSNKPIACPVNLLKVIQANL
ncbi:acyl-CoA thioesterase [Flavobacteriaceae bacterium]|nr:acyl-CoA thioesterase [Flavobacteriaceae bacterium]MDA9929208.1 acyl-CoA thioesterase [Flavobacteriaceae bacterium]MDC6457174.1 thioesterase family protein [Flavobacteriaceae bacterium]